MFLSVETFMFAYILLANVVSFLGVGCDRLMKKLNPEDDSRISEIIPQIFDLLISSAGGALGTALGMVVFRHRLDKKKFQIALLVAGILSVPYLIFLAYVYMWLFFPPSSIIT